MEKEIKMLRQKCGDMPGVGHFWPMDKKGARDYMEKEELATVLHLLSQGEKKVHLKEREFLVLFYERKIEKL